MKVVLDTNVLIAAFAARGLCESLFELCLEKHEIVVSEAILEEVAEKLDDKLGLPNELIEEILALLRDHAQLVEPTRVESDVCRDPDDLPILGTAEAAQAPFLITGDRDLLEIERFAGAAIVSPRQFWQSQREER